MVVVVPVQHAFDVGLAAARPDVDIAAAIAEHHGDLVGPGQRHQADRADGVQAAVLLNSPRRCERAAVASGVGDHQDLVVFFGDEPLGQGVPERAVAFQSMSRTSSPGT